MGFRKSRIFVGLLNAPVVASSLAGVTDDTSLFQREVQMHSDMEPIEPREPTGQVMVLTDLRGLLKQIPNMPSEVSINDLMEMGNIMVDMVKNDTMYDSIREGGAAFDAAMTAYIAGLANHTEAYATRGLAATTKEAAFLALKDYTAEQMKGVTALIGDMIPGMMKTVQVIKPKLAEILKLAGPMIKTMMQAQGGMPGMPGLPTGNMPDVSQLLDTVTKMEPDTLAKLAPMMITQFVGDVNKDPETACEQNKQYWPMLKTMTGAAKQGPKYVAQGKAMLELYAPSLSNFVGDAAPRILQLANSSMNAMGTYVDEMSLPIEQAFNTSRVILEDKMGCSLSTASASSKSGAARAGLTPVAALALAPLAWLCLSNLWA